LERLDLGPFSAISRLLASEKIHRAYALNHFSEIRHPVLRAVWAARMFEDGSASPQVIRFLKDVAQWTPVYRVLEEMMGREVESFQKRVYAEPTINQ